MKEITSAYQDLEKRMAIFVGLGAVLFVSLVNLATGADLISFLVRGLAVFLVFSLVGYWYGSYLSGLVSKEELMPVQPDDVEVTSINARPVELSGAPDAGQAFEPLAAPAVEATAPATQGLRFDKVLDDDATPDAPVRDLAAELAAGPGAGQG